MAVKPKYRFEIDGLIVQNPDGWRDFELRLKRDDDIAGLLVSSTNEFTFRGDGYDKLKSAFDVNYNDKLAVDIFVLTGSDYVLQYRGVIILTDVLFNLEKKTAATTIEDANFQGSIQANKNIKTFLDAGMSKNGEQLTTISSYNIQYFDAAGTYTPWLNRLAWKVKDALDFLVRFMTDDFVKGIQSAYLDDVDNFGGASLPYITTGESIRLANSDAPDISFSQLISFLSRTHDLTFDFITDSNGDPVMRIEERAYFFSTESSDTIRDIKDLTVEVDKNRIASHIEVGNNTTATSGNCSTTTKYFSFQKENYALRGKGNIDKLIDLTTDFITDSNVIEDIVATSTDAYDEEVIIVLANTGGTQATKFQSTSYCSNNFFYNLPYTNDNIIDRMLEAIPNSITKFLTGSTTPCKVEKGVDFLVGWGTIPGDPLPHVIPLHQDHLIDFTDSIYDFGSNYITQNTPRTHYDIPFTGNFSFEVRVKSTFIIQEVHTAAERIPTIMRFNYQVAIERWNVSFTTLKEQVLSDVDNFAKGRPGDTAQFFAVDRAITMQATMNCDTSDQIVVRVIYTFLSSENIKLLDINIPPLPSSYFMCTGADEDNGVFKVFNPNTFKARLYKFEKNLSLSRANNIRDNSRSSLTINELSDINLDKTAWIEEMTNNIETGRTSFTLIN